MENNAENNREVFVVAFNAHAQFACLVCKMAEAEQGTPTSTSGNPDESATSSTTVRLYPLS